jgi:hypothetical protein
VDISRWKSLHGEKQSDWLLIHCAGRSGGTSVSLFRCRSRFFSPCEQK